MAVSQTAAVTRLDERLLDAFDGFRVVLWRPSPTDKTLDATYVEIWTESGCAFRRKVRDVAGALLPGGVDRERVLGIVKALL